MIITAADNLFTRMVMPVRLKIPGLCEGGLLGKYYSKEGSREWAFPWNTPPHNNLKGQILLFHSPSWVRYHKCDRYSFSFFSTPHFPFFSFFFSKGLAFFGVPAWSFWSLMAPNSGNSKTELGLVRLKFCKWSSSIKSW